MSTTGDRQPSAKLGRSERQHAAARLARRLITMSLIRRPCGNRTAAELL